MRSASRMSLIAGALLSASGQSLVPSDPKTRAQLMPISTDRHRLTKAEKKRARKAAQRAKLAARSTQGKGAAP
jgi:hypothetical protein